MTADRIADRRTLVHKYLDHDFLQLVRQALSLQNRRRALKAGIEAIAALHRRDMVHLGIIGLLLFPISELMTDRYQARKHLGQLREQRPGSSDWRCKNRRP